MHIHKTAYSNCGTCSSKNITNRRHLLTRFVIGAVSTSFWLYLFGAAIAAENNQPYPTEITKEILKSFGNTGLTIEDGRVASFKIGEEIERAYYTYPIVMRKIRQIRHTEEGAIEEPVYVVSDKSGELLHVMPEYDGRNGTWGSSISEINVLSSYFSTQGNIHVGSTISDFIKAYPDHEFWYTYVSDRFILETTSLPKVQFEIEKTSYIGPGNILGTSDMDTLLPKHFSPTGKIIRIRVF